MHVSACMANTKTTKQKPLFPVYSGGHIQAQLDLAGIFGILPCSYCFISQGILHDHTS